MTICVTHVSAHTFINYVLLDDWLSAQFVVLHSEVSRQTWVNTV